MSKGLVYTTADLFGTDIFPSIFKTDPSRGSSFYKISPSRQKHKKLQQTALYLVPIKFTSTIYQTPGKNSVSILSESIL